MAAIPIIAAHLPHVEAVGNALGTPDGGRASAFRAVRLAGAVVNGHVLPIVEAGNVALVGWGLEWRRRDVEVVHIFVGHGLNEVV